MVVAEECVVNVVAGSVEENEGKADDVVAETEVEGAKGGIIGGREDGAPHPTPVEEGGGMKGANPLVREGAK